MALKERKIAAVMVVRAYNIGIKDERRQEEGKEDRGRGNKGAGEAYKKRKRLGVTYKEEGKEREGGRGGQ